MKIVADKHRCAGHARCAAMAETLFDLDDNGYIGFNEKPVSPGQEEAARRGVRACPERALKLVAEPSDAAGGASGATPR